MQKTKKSAALLMTMLIISVVLTASLGIFRIVVSSVGATAAMSDSIIADEASRGGIEWGLYQYKTNLSWVRGCAGVVPCERTFNNIASGVNVTVDVLYNETDPSGFVGLSVVSNGLVGRVQKQHIYQMYPY
jgi:hypothetical protein